MTNPLPQLNQKHVTRSFDLSHIISSEVTALDIASHGAYVIVGFGNGLILCYDMNSRFAEPCAIIAHIQAKGLHTNLLLSLKITEDCRFCFAGVKKGSSEMVAIDMGKLPVTTERNFRAQYLCNWVSTYTRQDPKLRGLGAACKVVRNEGSGSHSEYRLVCGLGIKNIHIWQFFPPGVEVGTSEPVWNCMYDVATNGNTIECVEFRNGGLSVLSKSAGVNIRFWDLSGFENDSTLKPPFEDISNTQDVRTIIDGYAFGGTYDFAVINTDAPKLANRDAFEIPERSTEDDFGQRRKRMMRQIEDVVGTQDAKHVLILCTDGGVVYFCNETAEGGGSTSGGLVEFVSIQRDVSHSKAWALKRLGRRGEVFLIRAVPNEDGGSSIVINPLEGFSSEICASELVIPGVSEDWHPGYYHDPILPPSIDASQFDVVRDEEIEQTLSRPPRSGTPIMKKSVVASLQSESSKKPLNSSECVVVKAKSKSPGLSLPVRDTSSPARVLTTRDDFSTPTATVSSIVGSPHISPQDIVKPVEFPKLDFSGPLNVGVGREDTPMKKQKKAQVAEDICLKRDCLVLGPPPANRKLVESTAYVVSSGRDGLDSTISKFTQARLDWINSCKAAQTTLHFPEHDGPSWGTQGSVVLMENQRLLSFICEMVCREVIKYFKEKSAECIADLNKVFYRLQKDYARQVELLLNRHRLELDSAIFRDSFLSGTDRKSEDLVTTVMSSMRRCHNSVSDSIRSFELKCLQIVEESIECN